MTETKEEIYKPLDSMTLAESPIDPQIRLGLQGYPKTGKTWAALTFPNPIVLNLDRGLGAHTGRQDVIDVPFYNPSFVDKIKKRDGIMAPPNRRDAILLWLSSEGMKLTSNQTLILDGSTQLQNACLAQYKLNPKLTKSGKIDDFGEWSDKVEYFGEVCELLKLLRCNVIYLIHETAARNDDGDLNGMVRPLLTGQFGDQIMGHFTDWFRCHAYGKPADETQSKNFLEKICGGNKDLYKEAIASTNEQHRTIYMWQTTSDNVAKCGSSTLVGVPKFIVASCESFNKYRRKGV